MTALRFSKHRSGVSLPSFPPEALKPVVYRENGPPTTMHHQPIYHLHLRRSLYSNNSHVRIGSTIRGKFRKLIRLGLYTIEDVDLLIVVIVVRKETTRNVRPLGGDTKGDGKREETFNYSEPPSGRTVPLRFWNFGHHEGGERGGPGPRGRCHRNRAKKRLSSAGVEALGRSSGSWKAKDRWRCFLLYLSSSWGGGGGCTPFSFGMGPRGQRELPRAAGGL